MIHPAVAADVDGIAAVQARGWQAAYRGIVPEATLRKVTVEHRSKMWAGARLGARAPEWPVFVAEGDGAVVGMAAVGPPRDRGFHYDAELYALYVDPGQWRRGIGRALFVRCVRDAWAQGSRSLYLWVFVANRPARQFYERMGGTPLEERVRDLDMDGTPVPELPYGWPSLPVTLLG